MSQLKIVMAEVRNNPGQSAEEIAKTIGKSRSGVSNTLLTLTGLKRVRRERQGHRTYSDTDSRRISRFVYFPLERAAPAPAPAPVVEDVVPNDTVPLAIDVLRLPLGEAREMYRQLCTIFADKNS